jgi:hypothetical protein
VFLPGGSDTTVRQNTQTSHKITHNTKKERAHKTTQTIKDTIHKMNTIQIRFTTTIKYVIIHKK